ncbi:hypothetical protein JTB14_001525 [Gonioctena quinquepunctata]|nr:hypothetical protein JTB14_001525 [Gonioctena quinquepunctata]
MTDACTKCNQDLGDKYAVCDSCHSVQHPSETCTGLSSSELRAVVLAKRTWAYFCQECRISFRNVPALLREMKSFKTEVTSLRSEMNILKTEVESLITEKIALKTEINDLRNEVKQIKENEVSETAPAESIIMEFVRASKERS